MQGVLTVGHPQLSMPVVDIGLVIDVSTSNSLQEAGNTKVSFELISLDRSTNTAQIYFSQPSSLRVSAAAV